MTDPQRTSGDLIEKVRQIVEDDPALTVRMIEEHEKTLGHERTALTAWAYVEAAYGRLDRSEDLLRSQLETSLDAPALLLLVMILTQQGRGSEAAIALRRHASIDDPDVHAAKFLVTVELEGRDTRSESALANIPIGERKGQIAVSGNVALTRGDVDRASEMASWASEYDGASPDLQRLLASLALRSGDPDEAVAKIDEYWTQSGSDSNWFFLEGVRLSNERRFEEAAVRFSEALSLRPHWKDALERAAKVALKLRRWEDVERIAVALESTSETDATAVRLAAAMKRGHAREFVRLIGRLMSIKRD